MQIKITDEQTLCMLQRAAWDGATQAMGNFEDDLAASVTCAEEDYRQCRSDATERLEQFGPLLALTERLENAQVGETVEVPEALRENLEYWSNEIVKAVHGNEARWVPRVLERLEWLSPAALRLAAELRTTKAIA